MYNVGEGEDIFLIAWPERNIEKGVGIFVHLAMVCTVRLENLPYKPEEGLITGHFCLPTNHITRMTNLWIVYLIIILNAT